MEGVSPLNLITWCMILFANTNLLAMVECGMLSQTFLATLQISSGGAWLHLGSLCHPQPAIALAVGFYIIDVICVTMGACVVTLDDWNMDLWEELWVAACTLVTSRFRGLS
jgi:hypothetical protein